MQYRETLCVVTVDLPPVISLIHILRFMCTYLNNKIYENF